MLSSVYLSETPGGTGDVCCIVSINTDKHKWLKGLIFMFWISSLKTVVYLSIFHLVFVSVVNCNIWFEFTSADSCLLTVSLRTFLTLVSYS